MGAGLLLLKSAPPTVEKDSQSVCQNERVKTMVQPEALASPIHECQKSLTWQEKQPRCRKNCMMMSLPTRNYALQNSSNLADSELSLTQSLNRRTSTQQYRHRRKRLLKLLKKCTQSIDGILSHSYVASMQSCERSYDLSSSLSKQVNRSQSTGDIDAPLIILHDEPRLQSACQDIRHSNFENKEILYRLQPLSPGVFSGNKQFSELVLPTTTSDNQIVLRDKTTKMLCSDMSSSENYDHRKLFITPKLRMGGSYSSSYVNDSEGSSYLGASCENALEILSSNMSRQSIDTLLSRQTDSTLNQAEYLNLMANGQSTPFLCDEEDPNALSFYYEDEFDVEKSPLGKPIHDSELAAAICTEYASLFHQAGDELTSVQGTTSNLSSDFENIFPTSISIRSECGSPAEENQSLEESVPSFTEMATAKHDYQLTFGGTGSLFSDGRSSCDQQSEESVGDCYESAESSDDEAILGQVNRRPNQVPKPPRVSTNDIHTSAKKVSFSDDVTEKNNAERMEEIENSTTWKEMKQNYTTWGQIKVTKEEPRKSRSTPDIAQVQMRKKKEKSLEEKEQEEKRRHSLTLWEMYKRAHSLSLSVSQSELKTPAAFKEDSVPENEDLKQSINDLLDNALGHKPRKNVTKSHPDTKSLSAPDLSFLKKNKHSLTSYNWWPEIFEQPSFCSEANSSNTCSQCDRRHSSDHRIIVFPSTGAPVEHKVCQLSMLNQMLSPTTACQCAREKLSDLSSGIATGSSGVTPREPSSWQHIAEFLKKRTRLPEAQSRGNVNSTLSDQQILDVVACIETADKLAKCQSQSSQTGGVSMHEVLMRVWRLASAIECLLSIGLKSHKYVTVAMGKIRTRVTIWDVVEESCCSAGNMTSNFSQIVNQVSTLKVDDISMRFCLFIVGLLNFQCLDFWLQIIQHNPLLLDKYYDADSYMRSKISGDKKIQTEMLQSLQPLSLNAWDLDYGHVIKACCSQPDQGRDPVRQELFT